MRIVGREHQVDDALPVLQLEGGELVLLGLVLCPFLLRFLLPQMSISFSSSSRRNFWLSVSFGSGFFGATSVSCAITAAPPPWAGTTNRLPSRT